jgi:hypothetical protein
MGPIEYKCRGCGHEWKGYDNVACPMCHEPVFRIVTGADLRERLLRSIDGPDAVHAFEGRNGHRPTTHTAAQGEQPAPHEAFRGTIETLLSETYWLMSLVSAGRSALADLQVSLFDMEHVAQDIESELVDQLKILAK